MKKRKLKKFVLPTLYLMILGIMAASITFLSKNLLDTTVEEDEYYNYSMSVFNDEEEPVNETQETPEDVKVSQPYTSEKVSIAKEYYDVNGSTETQEKALIYYGGTYMPNTGILYESDEAFDVVAIMDGTVKEIKEDEILGQVITIENNTKLTSIYYTLGEIKVNKGDKVTRSQVIATSGTSKLQTNKPQTLLFETYIDGVLTNPNTLFDKNISELN